MRFPRISPLIAASMLALTALGLAGCGSDSVGPSANSSSNVRGVNALQGCPGNVDIKQQTVLPVPFPNLIYGEVSPGSGYIPIRAGTANYGVYLAGQNSNPLATASVALSPHDPNGDTNSGTYSLVAAGACGAVPGVQAPQLLRLIDGFPTFTSASQGTVGFRVVNLIPDLNGTISLFSNGAALTGTDSAGTNGVPYAGSGNFPGSHYNAGISLAGNPTLTIRTSANAILTTVSSTFPFVAGHAYTLFVIGEVNPQAGGHPVVAVAVQDI